MREIRLVAGAERLELSTVGFGNRCSTIRTTPLANAHYYAQKWKKCKEKNKL